MSKCVSRAGSQYTFQARPMQVIQHVQNSNVGRWLHLVWSPTAFLNEHVCFLRRARNTLIAGSAEASDSARPEFELGSGAALRLVSRCVSGQVSEHTLYLRAGSPYKFRIRPVRMIQHALNCNVALPLRLLGSRCNGCNALCMMLSSIGLAVQSSGAADAIDSAPTECYALPFAALSGVQSCASERGFEIAFPRLGSHYQFRTRPMRMIQHALTSSVGPSMRLVWGPDWQQRSGHACISGELAVTSSATPNANDSARSIFGMWSFDALRLSFGCDVEHCDEHAFSNRLANPCPALPMRMVRHDHH